MLLSFRFAGWFLIAAGVCVGCFLWKLPPDAETLLDRLPDYDHTAAARRLMAEKKYGEAKVLCQDIIAQDLPGKKAAGLIVRMCDDKLDSVKIRLRLMAESFVTGNPGSSIEQAGAAVVSDMMMYGDIRDLVLQGYYKVTGKETDPYVAAFAAAGLVSEIFDAVDWLPALFKALRRTGAIPDRMARDIIRLLRKGPAGNGRMVTLCRNMKDIFLRGGYLRTGNIFKNLERTEDIASAARMIRRSPAAAHLVSRASGKNTAEVFRLLTKEKHSRRFLKKLLSKGPDGMTLLLRFAKSSKKGNVEIFASQTLGPLKEKLGVWIWGVPLLLMGTGILLNLRSIIKIKSMFRRKI